MRRLTVAILPAAAALGFAAGWFPGRQSEAPMPANTPHPAAMANDVFRQPLEAPPRLPELTSPDECRAFLLAVDQQFARRHPLVRHSARDYALRRWIEIDAESALAEAERQPGQEWDKSGFGVDLFRVWLDLDIDSAVGAWNQASPNLARHVRLTFLTALAEKDPPRAFAEWQTPRGGTGPFDSAGPLIFRCWAQQDPKTAAEKATGQTRRVVMEEWLRIDPAEAVAYVCSHQAGRCSLNAMGSLILPELLRSDPAAAVEATKSAARRGFALEANEWASRDPLSALRWAHSEPSDAPMVRDTLTFAAGKLASSDPGQAIAILQSLPKGSSSQHSSYADLTIRMGYREAFASLAAADPDRARELITTQPAMAAPGGLDGYLTFAFGHDTAGAIAQYREWLANPELAPAVLSSILMTFRWQDGAGARDPSDVIAALPELANQMDRGVLSGWAKANPTGAAEFIAQRAAAGTPVNDLKSEGVLAEIAIAEPEWTAAWLVGLPDAALQQEAAQTLVANWAAFDPEAAEHWMASLPEGALVDAAGAGLARRNEVGDGGEE